MEPNAIPEPVLETLTRYVLGELKETEREAFERELARSPALREEHAVLRQVLQAVEHTAPGSSRLSEDQREALRQAAGAGVRPSPAPVLSSGRWMAPLAVAATVLLAAFLVLRDRPTQDSPGDLRVALAPQVDFTGGYEEPAPDLLRAYTDRASKPGEHTDGLASDRSRLVPGSGGEKPPAEGKQQTATGVDSAFVTHLSTAPTPETSGLRLPVEQLQQSVQLQTEARTHGLATPPATKELQVLYADVQGPGGAAPTTGGGGGGSGAPAGPQPTGGGARGTELFYGLGGGADVRARGENRFGTSALGLGDTLERLTEADPDPTLAGGAVLHLELGRPDDGRRAVRSVDDIFQSLARRPGETPDMMFFRYWGDNPSIRAELDARSTFALDVDTASYSLIRNYLTQGILPPKAAVRTEEFVNSFRYDLAPPTDGVFAVAAEVGPSPFGDPRMQLVRVALKAKEVTREERKPVALTFVIDVSGSMQRENRLELVKQALRLLVQQFDERDTIGIVTFQSTAQQVLAPHSIQHRNLVLGAIDGLQAGGSTNAGDGLLQGFQMALAQFRDEAENRILLLSDGVANTGVTDLEGILQSVEKYREARIYLSSVGVGMGNHNDALLEQLADRGDGFYAYVDSMDEAREVFVERMVGSMQTVAKDARVQVEWNPETVRRYRLLGYENRAVADQDFRNTSIDAGEIGAGHEVTALYEIEPREDAGDGPLATLRLFFQEPESDTWIEQERAIRAADAATSLAATSPSFRLAAAVAEFAEILRQSTWARGGSLGEVLALADPLVAAFDGDQDVAEFVALVRQAAALPDLLPVRTDLTRAVDEFKRNQHLRAMLEDLKDQQEDPLLRQLEEENRELEQRIRELIERRLEDR